MNILKKVFTYILNPFKSFGLGKLSDKVVEYLNNKNVLIYIFSFIISILVVLIKYVL